MNRRKFLKTAVAATLLPSTLLPSLVPTKPAGAAPKAATPKVDLTETTTMHNTKWRTYRPTEFARAVDQNGDPCRLILDGKDNG